MPGTAGDRIIHGKRLSRASGTANNESRRIAAGFTRGTVGGDNIHLRYVFIGNENGSLTEEPGDEIGGIRRDRESDVLQPFDLRIVDRSNGNHEGNFAR